MGETIAKAASSVPESRAKPISTSMAIPASLWGTRGSSLSQTVITISLGCGSIFLAVEVVITIVLSFARMFLYTFVPHVCSEYYYRTIV